MNKGKYFLVGLLAMVVLVVSGCSGNGQSRDREDTLTGMSLEQKVGQMLAIGIQGTELTPETIAQLETIQPGGIILFARNIQGPTQLEALTRALRGTVGADAPPLFISTDQEGGEIIRVDWIGDGVPQADISGDEQAYQIGYGRGVALANLGINQNLGPVLDVGIPDDFLTRYGRCLPGNASEVGRLAKNIIAGQKDGGILSTAKHFPGYGGITFDPENEGIATLPAVPETSQFAVAMEAGPEFVMTANVIYEDIDAAAPFTLTPSGIDYLHGQLGEDFIVLSDDLTASVLKAAYSLPVTVVMAARAGVDMLLISGNEQGDPSVAFDALLTAVRNGELSQEDIDSHVNKILELKKDL
jgi:beta-N-acetylhexosaminidase